MKNYKELANNIISEIGGKNNVRSITHCATRLRFQLKDNSKPSKEKVSNLDGVINVIESGGQFQVIIGNEVAQVFDEIESQLGIHGEVLDVVEKDDLKVKTKFTDKIIDLVTGIFTPILPVLIGGGMIRAILMIATTYFGMSNTSGLYVLLNEIYVAVYSFLPIYLGYAAALKFKSNPYIATAISIVMVSPTIMAAVQGETGLSIFGITMSFPKQGYGSSVIPIIVTIYFMSLLEKLCNKYLHAAVKNILTPLITLFVTVPLMFMIIGPVTSILQDLLGSGYKAIYDFSPTLTGIVLGGLWQVLVVFGLHWGIIPLGQINLSQYGRNTINAVTGPSNWSQAGAALGVALKTKNKKLKDLGLSAALTGFFSITEPSIYGVNLKYKKPFYIAVVMSAISGGIAGFANSAAIAGGPVGILSFPLFIGEGFIGFVIAMIFAFISSAILSYLFGYDEKNDEV